MKMRMIVNRKRKNLRRKTILRKNMKRKWKRKKIKTRRKLQIKTRTVSDSNLHKVKRV